VLRTAAALKRQGRSVRAICLDFHSTGGDKVTYRDWLKGLAIDLGLNEIECTFTSEFMDDWHVRVPREVVRDLMLLSNIFVMPSRSETYSLVTQEAALCGAFLVLNQDFGPFRDIYGPQAAYYQFSSNVDNLTGQDGSTETKYGDTDAYFHDIALRVGYELDNNVVLAQKTRIRKERNPGAIFKRYIEPLFCFGDG
jgi:glycosyltransferase involved in cell wall biosynthesis